MTTTAPPAQPAPTRSSPSSSGGWRVSFNASPRLSCLAASLSASSHSALRGPRRLDLPARSRPAIAVGDVELAERLLAVSGVARLPARPPWVDGAGPRPGHRRGGRVRDRPRAGRKRDRHGRRPRGGQDARRPRRGLRRPLGRRPGANGAARGTCCSRSQALSAACRRRALSSPRSTRASASSPPWRRGLG